MLVRHLKPEERMDPNGEIYFFNELTMESMRQHPGFASSTEGGSSTRAGGEAIEVVVSGAEGTTPPSPRLDPAAAQEHGEVERARAELAAAQEEAGRLRNEAMELRRQASYEVRQRLRQAEGEAAAVIDRAEATAAALRRAEQAATAQNTELANSRGRLRKIGRAFTPPTGLSDGSGAGSLIAERRCTNA